MRLLWLPVAWFAAELLLLIVVAGKIGAWATLGWLALAGVVGVLLLRGQQVSMLGAVERHGRLSPDGVREGGFRVLAALLLIVPGFLSDAMALVFLLPPLRVALGALLLKLLPVERFTVYRPSEGEVFEHEARAEARVIEGEVVSSDAEE